MAKWNPVHEEPLPKLPLVILHLDADGEHFAASDGVFYKGQWFDLTEWLGNEELGGGVEAIEAPLYWSYLPPRVATSGNRKG